VISQASQRSLFASGTARLDAAATPRRLWLDPGSWLDHWSPFVEGADSLFDTLASSLPWRQARRQMYERVVDVPRLTCGIDLEEDTVPELIERVRGVVSEHYDVGLCGAFAAYYRDGRDSVAWHADRVDLERAEHTTGIVSLGGPRKLMLRPKGGGQSRTIVFESGDLLVMGGAIQHRWEHAVPKVAHAYPRIALIFFADDREPPPMLETKLAATAQSSGASSSSKASQASRTRR
jgi:alkylated DNA repair dioxygenase AlkB